ncbi:hypothetical protein F511_19431 [Dorcoceras hygrometricum]|uniref:4Fe-4S ferredoxin-type domain-containing protein n=1 Tax=Dorcoceras hygrometricum TaxID=472368 RepID=A0A2Z7CL94_9LAMI|nr:hypothetical protein F511_19431 [Dorcoceras hygrometricum]
MVCEINHQLHERSSSSVGLEKVKYLLTKTGIPSSVTSPLESLQKGNWVKLICGASFEDVVDIRNLSLVYTLAGVDCIDCASEASVINAVNDGIESAKAIIPIRRPWVMVSVNDDEDLHFRKAEFDPENCPVDCSRPCERICPANAISYTGKAGLPKVHLISYILQGGVLAERCYGCGRCLPICPYEKIRASTYVRDAAATAELLKQDGVDAIEIHTNGRKVESFQELWNSLGDSIEKLRLVAVSLPDTNELTIPVMHSIYATMNANLRCHNLWQLDGRPMSGDIGRGATRQAITFALHISAARDRPKGFLQLAGGNNAYTVDGLKKEGLFKTTSLPEKLNDEATPFNSSYSSDALIGGVAFGSYARKIVGKVLSSLQMEHGYVDIEAYPEYLLEALTESLALVGTVKCFP